MNERDDSLSSQFQDHMITREVAKEMQEESRYWKAKIADLEQKLKEANEKLAGNMCGYCDAKMDHIPESFDLAMVELAHRKRDIISLQQQLQEANEDALSAFAQRGRAESELTQLRQELTQEGLDHNHTKQELENVKDERDQIATELKLCQERFSQYGWHQDNCSVQRDDSNCTCGWLDAKRALRKDEK